MRFIKFANFLLASVRKQNYYLINKLILSKNLLFLLRTHLIGIISLNISVPKSYKISLTQQQFFK